MRVLLVEDEPYMAEAIRDGLRLEAIVAGAPRVSEIIATVAPAPGTASKRNQSPLV